ncbi:uncharacterized protein A4U43_UnF8910 [Asparagus officinalis]|uniref:Uncharacterized protein n=1 Tax=Asparagus officinalis TaxID=4686 RepID=A0A1R3L5V3_ASPOF|nr:uncharacterized protein A4U43_UnF8910 [Asparagus officinalis]
MDPEVNAFIPKVTDVFFMVQCHFRTVVLSYRKQKKDFDDRLKIEKAEAEERKKMRELERDMIGLEGSGDDEIEENEGVGEELLQLKSSNRDQTPLPLNPSSPSPQSLYNRLDSRVSAAQFGFELLVDFASTGLSSSLILLRISGELKLHSCSFGLMNS